MLVNRNTLSMHSRWIAVFVTGTVLTMVWYFFYASNDGSDRWPGGSSPPGLTFGIVGGAIMLFEFLLWPKKKLRRFRFGRAQVWMRAHIWLGLLTVPLISFHAGVDWGGELTWILMVLFWFVIVSGVLGLLLQNVLPRLLLSDVPAETIYSQIDHVSSRYATEAENVVRACCGHPAEDWITTGSADHSSATAMIVGAERTMISTKVDFFELKNESQANMLMERFESHILPYLSNGARSGSMLRKAGQSGLFYDGLRTSLPADVHPVLDQLEEWTTARRQFDRQAKIHGWLHGWLSIHLPLSVALILLMFVHILFALKYR